MGLGARLHGLLKDEASIATFTQYICLSPGMPLMREQGSSLHGHQAEKILHATKHIQVIRVSFDVHYPPPTVVVVSPFLVTKCQKKAKPVAPLFSASFRAFPLVCRRWPIE